jgi:hypothetical protein
VPPGLDLEIQGHVRVIEAGLGIRRRIAIEHKLHVASRHAGQLEVAVGIGVGQQIRPAEHIDLDVFEWRQKYIVSRERNAVRAAPKVVEGHRLEVIARVEHLAAQRGVGDGCQAHRAEAV